VNQAIGAFALTLLAAVGTWGGSVAPGGTRQFTIRPNNGLAVGTYNPTITITGSDGTSAQVKPTFSVMAGLFVALRQPHSWCVGVNGGTSSSFFVDSNTTWSVSVQSDEPNWLSASSASGTGNGSFTLTATANSGKALRKGTVTITASGCTPEIINVTQLDKFADSDLFVKPSNVYYHPLAKFAIELSYGTYFLLGPLFEDIFVSIIETFFPQIISIEDMLVANDFIGREYFPDPQTTTTTNLVLPPATISPYNKLEDYTYGVFDLYRLNAYSSGYGFRATLGAHNATLAMDHGALWGVNTPSSGAFGLSSIPEEIVYTIAHRKIAVGTGGNTRDLIVVAIRCVEAYGYGAHAWL